MNGKRTPSSTWTRACMLASALSLASGLPAWSISQDYDHGTVHERSVHQGTHHFGTGTNPHGMNIKGYGSSQPHFQKENHHNSGSTQQAHAHQSAINFIEHILRFKEGMAITDEQEAQLKGIETNYKKARITMTAEVELANLDFHEILKNEDADLSGIESQLRKVHALRADLYMASITAKRKAKEVLTPEQRHRMKIVHDRIRAAGSTAMKSGHAKKSFHHAKSGEKESY